jgi:hypothetical protein
VRKGPLKARTEAVVMLSARGGMSPVGAGGVRGAGIRAGGVMGRWGEGRVGERRRVPGTRRCAEEVPARISPGLIVGPVSRRTCAGARARYNGQKVPGTR